MAKQRSIVADRIEDLLDKKGMSITELSEASGVSVSAISNILNGVRKQPRSDTVQKIAKGFPTSASYLNGETNNSEPSDAPPLPDYAVEVMDSMRKLDKGRNYELLLIAKSFVEANAVIRQMTRQEVIDSILEAGDELGSEEETNKVVKYLHDLERRWGDDNEPPSLLVGEPTQPSE